MFLFCLNQMDFMFSFPQFLPVLPLSYCCLTFNMIGLRLKKQGKEMRKGWEPIKHVRGEMTLGCTERDCGRAVCAARCAGVRQRAHEAHLLYLSPRTEGKKREEVRRLALERFNQGASNPAWPTLSSIIDACLSLGWWIIKPLIRPGNSTSSLLGQWH